MSETVEVEKPRRTRGRPAKRHDEMLEVVDESKLTRRSGADSGEMFTVPERLKRSGWDYAWWPVSVVGQPVDPAREVELHDGGWRPVPLSHMTSLMPPGWHGKTIDRGGQRLYHRPMRLTEEARAEYAARAIQQKEDRMAGALAAPEGHLGKRVVLNLEHGIQPVNK